MASNSKNKYGNIGDELREIATNTIKSREVATTERIYKMLIDDARDKAREGSFAMQVEYPKYKEIYDGEKEFRLRLIDNITKRMSDEGIKFEHVVSAGNVKMEYYQLNWR